jgi:hypothetical protein
VNSSVNWPALLGMLSVIMGVGALCCVAAVFGAVRSSLMDALRSE